MAERASIYAIPHKDGTLTLLGGQGRIKDMFKKNSTVEEEDIKGKLADSPLPLTSEERTIVGWGGSSVVFRVPSKSNSSVAVLRSEEIDLGNLKPAFTNLASERQTNAALAPFTIPQSFVLTEGLDHGPAILKVSPEVRGATFKELSPLFIVRNKAVLQQYIDLNSKALAYFLNTGRLIDTVGHFRSRLPFIWDFFGLSPFSTSNLMVNFETNKLVLVDSEPSKLMKSQLKFRPQLIVRAASLAASIGIAQGLIAINDLRDRLFTQTAANDRKKASPEDEIFLEGIKDVIKTLDGSGIDYRVLGSLAIAASIQTHGGNYYLTPKRTNGVVRDIDVLILNSAYQGMDRLNRYFIEKRDKDKFYPEVYLSSPLNLENPDPRDFQTGSVNIILSRSALDQKGNFYAIYRNTQREIPNPQLKSVFVEYEGIRFPTVDSGTLAGFALARYGAIRAKDIEKITKLLSTSGKHIPPEFLDYAREVRTNYSVEFRNFLTRDLIAHFSGERLGTGQLSHLRNLIRSLFRPKHGKKMVTEILTKV